MELCDQSVSQPSAKRESEDFTHVAESEEPTCKRCKLTISDCWNFFTKIGVGKDGSERARCNACRKEFKVEDRLDGTALLIHHIEQCDEIEVEDARQLVNDTEGQSKYPEIFQLVLRKMAVAMVLESDFPIGAFYRGPFLRWVQYLNPNVMPISSDTIRADVLKIHMREKEKLKQTLASIPNRICLTSYLWTTCTTELYICLSAHFVDSNWKLNSKILDFCYISCPYSGFEIPSEIQECLREWGIEKRIFSLTYDNDPDNDGMQENLKTNLSVENWLLCDGEFFNVRCCAHILDLIVQEGLEACNDVLDKIRESVAYVTASKSRRIEFKKCAGTLGGKATRLELRRDSPTRLNSTYLMLECAVKKQSAFVNFQVNDHGFKCCPSVEEWKRAEKMYKFLLPVYDIMKLFSDTSYPTSNLYFLQIHQIQLTLQESLNSEDETIRSVGEKMLIEFKTYWEEYSVVLGLAAVLDPRIKLSSLEFLFSKIDPSTSHEKTEHVKRKLYKLFEGYTSNNNIPSTTSNVQSATPTRSHPAPSSSAGLNEMKQRMFGALKHHELALRVGKSQLDVYLDEPNLNFDYYEDLDVLEWWKYTQKRFPELSKMACDLLSIPITSVASKFDFSIGARVLRKYRSSTLSKNHQAFICSRTWLCGFYCKDEDEDLCDCDEDQCEWDCDEDEDEEEDEDEDDDDDDGALNG
ncbi:zinc finger BED domain-containing protein RICESLEEPER 2-like isoform X1 [Arachis stenosperma]|uniref:zinc finger BED domain-containing protein RICESLEEPER 2-like isoform X1 n=1 Tax=Arachis stenosperma TaxID=217475 RepID=UPI0025AD12A1|nr:zinc finger BED domain-containing protein RICESLEEPER 2-like isoform X1 [Arachis stenosperma]